ncbi:MAG: hypothetical protein LBH50_05120 [Spirochaetaceae bacterium]|jgi:hypothetical protein|nr:hypothetical protein [Spirochaetaceae bacterium]
MEYELIHEIVNPCAGDKRPEVLVSEVDTDDLDAYVRQVFSGTNASFKKSENDSGSAVYELVTDGQKHRLTFSP